MNGYEAENMINDISHSLGVTLLRQDESCIDESHVQTAPTAPSASMAMTGKQKNLPPCSLGRMELEPKVGTSLESEQPAR